MDTSSSTSTRSSRALISLPRSRRPSPRAVCFSRSSVVPGSTPATSTVSAAWTTLTTSSSSRSRPLCDVESAFCPSWWTGQAPPHRSQLPDALAPLANRNAVRVNHETFRSDVDTLLRAIAMVLHLPGSTSVTASGPRGSETPSGGLGRTVHESAAEGNDNHPRPAESPGGASADASRDESSPAAVRPLRARRDARLRRHVRGAPGARRPPRPGRRHQGAACRPGPRPAVPGAVPARGPERGGAEPPGDRRGLRHRRDQHRATARCPTSSWSTWTGGRCATSSRPRAR